MVAINVNIFIAPISENAEIGVFLMDFPPFMTSLAKSYIRHEPVGRAIILLPHLRKMFGTRFRSQ